VLGRVRQSRGNADAFAAAAAHELDATLITGDPELEQLEGQIKLEKLSRTKRS
jgi:hypothetical protein